MRRLLPYSLLFLLAFGGIASADRDRRDRRNDRREQRHERRDDRRDRRHNRRVEVRDHRRYNGPVRGDRRRIDRRHVRAVNGRYVFGGGVTYTYRRPVIRERYYNVRVRPQIVVEQYAQQPGYVWVQGSWSWNGGEWMWNAGYYAPDPSITVYYDDGSWE